MTENKVMLTTVDNPFDPIDDFTSWRRFDEEKGYYTCNKLARIADLREDMSQKEEDEAIEQAADTIILYDPLGLYRKVKKEIPFIE